MNDKKQIFGWVMYDWANSAYVTTVTAAVLPAYFAGIVVPAGGLKIAGLIFSATSLWGYMLSFSTLFVFLFAPILGAISDFSSSKKKFLMVSCYTGSLFASLLIFCGSGDIWLTMLFFSISQICFVGGNVFYDAFLPHIVSPDKLDWVSGKGYAFGYIGGGIQFALSLSLIAGHTAIGISEPLAARIAMTTAGLWWAGFSVITFIRLKETSVRKRIPQAYEKLPLWLAYATIGFKRTIATVKKVRTFRHLSLYLIAFMIFNDGIQTVISMATIYGKDELGLSTTVLMVTLLIIQIIAIFGALVFGKLGEIMTTKRALMITLVLWSFVVIYAYFMTTPTEYFILGIIVGIVMGGSQALGRSLYSSMIPVNASAEFFGFYSVFEKFSAIWGPLVFAFIRQMTGTSRLAIVSLIVFFVVGIILLNFVNVEEAKKAKLSTLF